MINLNMVDGSTVETLDTHENLAAALDRVYSLWMEDGGEGHPVFLAVDDDGRTVAVVTRSGVDPTVAITVRYEADGLRVDHHRCTYNLDVQGRYLSTTVRDYRTGLDRVMKG